MPFTCNMLDGCETPFLNEGSAKVLSLKYAIYLMLQVVHD